MGLLIADHLCGGDEVASLSCRVVSRDAATLVAEQVLSILMTIRGANRRTHGDRQMSISKVETFSMRPWAPRQRVAAWNQVMRETFASAAVARREPAVRRISFRVRERDAAWRLARCGFATVVHFAGIEHALLATVGAAYADTQAEQTLRSVNRSRVLAYGGLRQRDSFRSRLSREVRRHAERVSAATSQHCYDVIERRRRDCAGVRGIFALV